MTYRILFGATSYVLLACITYLNVSESNYIYSVLKMDKIILLYMLPLSLIILAALARIILAFRFKHLMSNLLAEKERSIDLSDADTMVWVGITLTAFFALVGTSSALQEIEINAKPIILFVLISFIMFNASNSLKSYKFKIWQQQLGEILEGIARLSFLSAILVTAWQTDFNYFYLWAISLLTFSSWLIDYIARYYLWSNIFKGVS